MPYQSRRSEYINRSHPTYYEEAIAERSFRALEKGILNFMNETNFKRFVMILRSGGLVESYMIRSQNAIDFAYIIYLVLRFQSPKVDSSKIESHVCKWFVMSILTGRYSGSPESSFGYDINRIDEMGFAKYMAEVEAVELSDAFWNVG